jgi:tRNA threonylcarbamoyladenosine biosynthesis protein TsaE
MTYETHSPSQTRDIATQIATHAAKGDVVCLSGPLAAGKTEFTKGFAQGLGIGGVITSPTFTIVNEYKGGLLPLYHFDVYRISTSEQMQDTGYEEYFYGDGVCVIEWAELIAAAGRRDYD